VVTAIDMGRALVAAVALERLVELAVSRRNARRLLARGAVSAGRGHYPAMVAFHLALLAACVLEPALWPTPWPAGAALSAAALVALAQALRWWAVGTLGERWSTEVIVVPGAAPVRAGPYRWLRHPNYLAVVIEVAALPLAAGAWRTAVVGTLLNAAILAVRIRVEERAMGEAWRAAFRGVGRFLPSFRPDPHLNLNPAVRAHAPDPVALFPGTRDPDPGLGARGTGHGPRDADHGDEDPGSGSGSGIEGGPHDRP
jgi:methyltransferase